jgi:predicted PhzF superfamily epimerase YddE/YHI9
MIGRLRRGEAERSALGCGSGNGCVAALVRRDNILKKGAYHASQGRYVGRDGRVAIEFDNDTIWLGGHAVTCIEGWLNC